ERARAARQTQPAATPEAKPETEVTPTRGGLVGKEVGKSKYALDPATRAAVEVAEWVTARLRSPVDHISKDALLLEASKRWKGTLGTGAFTMKDVADAMELGVNQYIRETGFGGVQFSTHP